MAGKQEEGTGKHKHKSAEEPFPHNDASSTGGSKSKSGSEQHASGKNGGGSQSRGSSESSSSAKSNGGGDDLKSREYTGPDGEVHHHTRTYAEQHKK